MISPSSLLPSGAPGVLPGLEEGALLCIAEQCQGLVAARALEAYIQLTDAEKAFRIQKDDLRLRPIRHQKESRV